MPACRATAVTALAAGFLLAGMAGCGGGGRGRLIDERHGTFAGVGIGDTPPQVKRVFGSQPAEGTGAIAPTGHDFVDMGGPSSISTPCHPPRRPHPVKGPAPVWLPPGLRYEDVSFLVCGNRIYAVIVAEAGAKSRKGVAIGDDLEEAEAAYPELACGRAPYGEALFGPRPTYPYCAGQLERDRWIWFGEDPIASITVSRTRMGMPIG